MYIITILSTAVLLFLDQIVKYLAVLHLKGQAAIPPIRIVAVLIVAGAIGNMIDRVVHQYVIDFFYFKLINFPIFNVADIYVVVACILFILLMLFYYKEEELG